MGTKLVIVESPTKMKSIAGYLGDGYNVMSSVGHVRDLVLGKNLSKEDKKGPYGKFGIDIEGGFIPKYVVSPNKKTVIADLKKALKNADELILATDEDREGEAIAWHLVDELKPKVPVSRMVFHEITKDAIQEAVKHRREIDSNLVDAQEARRIIDRLIGFELSPLLWRWVTGAKSAGRVQTPAVRLVVDREVERLEFRAANYWSLTATLNAGTAFPAKLARINGNRVATGDDFDDKGNLKKSDAIVLDETAATALSEALTGSSVKAHVKSVDSKPYSRKPAAPFTTSTLQQEAGRKLRFSSRQAMSVAQSLYENGYITYMRTDSSSLSSQAINAARTQATAMYGADAVPAEPRLYASKSKNAQEAHEAIRPAGDVFRTPAELASKLGGPELKLYDLIWKRTIASQMTDAKGQTATITIEVGPTGANSVEVASNALAEFTASGTVITHKGFLAAYEETTDEQVEATENHSDAEGAEPGAKAEAETVLPNVEVGQEVFAEAIDPKSHETTPPARYTEASLVKRLEELGIGRPSTYASILQTVQEKGYVYKKGQALFPSWLAMTMIRLFEQTYDDLVDYPFTAQMEDELDEIAGGRGSRQDWLHRLYFGDGASHRGFRDAAGGVQLDKGVREMNEWRVFDGHIIRTGRFGPSRQVPDPETDGVDVREGEKPRYISIPEEIPPADITKEMLDEWVNAPVAGDRVLGVHPESGLRIAAKDGRYGPYVTEIPDDIVDEETGEVRPGTVAKNGPKMRTASLFKSMNPAEVDFETAMKLMELPRLVGHDPESGEEIRAQNGRYGAYLTRGKETRSLPSEEAIFEIDEAGALELFAQPKFANRRASSALKEFEGTDPVSGKAVKVKDGRFGPYVTDGTTNATIPKGDSIEGMSFERACELLAIKREKVANG